jgi:hypothetical protein
MKQNQMMKESFHAWVALLLNHWLSNHVSPSSQLCIWPRALHIEQLELGFRVCHRQWLPIWRHVTGSFIDLKCCLFCVPTMNVCCEVELKRSCYRHLVCFVHSMDGWGVALSCVCFLWWCVISSDDEHVCKLSQIVAAGLFLFFVIKRISILLQLLRASLHLVLF